MARSVDPHKVAAWQARFGRFSAAEMSVAQFCRDEGVSQASFFSWRKKLAAQKYRPQSTRATLGSLASPNESPAPVFQSVRVVSAGSIAVELRGGTKLQIPTHDAYALELAIQTLVCSDALLSSGGETC